MLFILFFEKIKKNANRRVQLEKNKKKNAKICVEPGTIQVNTLNTRHQANAISLLSLRNK